MTLRSQEMVPRHPLPIQCAGYTLFLWISFNFLIKKLSFSSLMHLQHNTEPTPTPTLGQSALVSWAPPGPSVACTPR